MLKSSVQTITPERAAELLRSSFGKIQQRGVKSKVVANLVNAIEGGRWQVTHQGIAIDEDGVVIDGQHRLMAIEQAGIPVEIMVTENVPRSAFTVIDVGAKRTTADSLHIAGFTSTAVLAAAARLVLTWKAVEANPNTTTWGQAYGRLGTPDIVDFMHTELGETLVRSQAPANRVAAAWGRVGVRSFMTATIGLMSELDTPASMRAEFIERCIDGAYLRPTSPILALRRYFIADTGWVRVPNSSASRSRAGMSVVVKAFNEYLLGADRHIMAFKETENQPRFLSWKTLDQDTRAALLEREQAAIEQEKAEAR